MTTENVTANPGTQAPGATGGTEGQQPWFNSFDDETKGYIQNKGLSTKTANEAFLTVTKMHRDAEKLIGAPANELLRLPKDQASPEWNNVYKRLGALGAPEEYKFEGVKHAGDKPLNEALTDTLRKAAHGAHLSPDAANEMAKAVVKHLDDQTANTIAEKALNLDKEKRLLADNWGRNEAANMVIARSAAQALGVPPEAVSALEGVAGYSKVMEMFRQIGMKIGEGRFVQNDSTGNDKVMTKEQAVSQKAELKRDEAWVKRYLAGGQEERRRMDALDRIISGTVNA